MFSLFKNHGILGLNARSLLYIKPFNPKKATALADSKLKTKAYLAARGIPVAKFYGRIENRQQLRSFDFSQLPDSCVLKPNQGFGGEGIIILKGRDKQGRFLRNGKKPIENEELIEHIEDILEGKFSLKGVRDMAFFEQILVPHECFARFRPAGLPDIRVIVFNMVPVMAMLRIPTAESDGKANIHLGGIGIGIDIAKGVTTYAAQYRHMVEKLPHGEILAGHVIPHWEAILLTCSRIQQLTNIGYLACDITIDQDMGPALLEVNARAGLTVQLANLAPLRARLERVQGLTVESPEKGVRIGQDLFGKKATKKAVPNTEKPTLGLRESIDITLGDGSSISVPCMIAGDKERTSFTPDLIRELAEKNGVVPAQEKDLTYKVKFTLLGKKIQTVVTEDSEIREVRAVIGKRDLAGFLIDPFKKSQHSAPGPTVKRTDLRAVDNLLGQLDRDLLLLKLVKPINLIEESERLKTDHLYNPTFLYPESAIDLDDAMRRLQSPIPTDSALGNLLEKKRVELLLRIELIRARGNASRFTDLSEKIFGTPNAALLKAAKAVLHERFACDLPPPVKKRMTAEKVAERFRKILDDYALHNWQVSVRENLVADVTVGGNQIYIRLGALFTPEHVASLIAHEIETHVLTSENGDHQEWQLLRRGCAGYLDTQEGLAIYNQNQVIGLWSEKRFHSPKNVLGLAFSLRHSLAESRAYLKEELGYDEEKALTQSIAMKRGLSDTSEHGGFTKSLVYFRGLQAVEEFIQKGGDLKRLYIGKVSLEDLDLVEQIPDLKSPLILPEFLRES